jgi:hypothetical protein
VDQLTDAQTTGIVGLEQDAVPSGPSGVQELQDFLRTEDHGQLPRLLAVGQLLDPLGPTQGEAVEQTPGTNRLVEATPGDTLLQHVQLEGAQLLGPQLVGGAVEVSGQACHCGHIGLDSTGRIIAQPEVVEKELP